MPSSNAGLRTSRVGGRVNSTHPGITRTPTRSGGRSRSMSDQPFRTVDVGAWIESTDDPTERTVRRVMRTILQAVARSPALSGMMVIKGGVLLALGYGTHRHTKDVDFSVDAPIQQENPDAIRESLQQALAAVCVDHDLLCRVQSDEVRPAKANATHPTLRLKIGYAVAGSAQHRRMVQGRPSASTVTLDLSFNERTCRPATIVVDGHELVAYSLFDQIAEKYRAIIQQTSERRDRVRRQDVYDIFKILEQGHLASMDDRLTLLEIMRQRSG